MWKCSSRDLFGPLLSASLNNETKTIGGQPFSPTRRLISREIEFRLFVNVSRIHPAPLPPPSPPPDEKFGESLCRGAPYVTIEWLEIT